MSMNLISRYLQTSIDRTNLCIRHLNSAEDSIEDLESKDHNRIGKKSPSCRPNDLEVQNFLAQINLLKLQIDLLEERFKELDT
jgi:prefoldin subunit 5